MKKFIISLLIVAAFVAIPVSVFAAVPVSESSDAKANIISAIELAHNVDLDFGTISTSGTAGTVVLSAAATTVLTPTNVSTVGTGQTAAKFTATGQPGAAFTVNLPTAAIPVSNGTETMSVGSWTVDGTPSKTIGASGTEFYVGATLSIDATQATGVYTGSFDVTVNYN